MSARRSRPKRASPAASQPVARAAVDWLSIRPRAVSSQQWTRFERYVTEIFQAFGMDLQRPGTDTTPRRFLRALYDATAGYEGDPKLVTAFPNECKGSDDCAIAQIVEGPIPFHALCEHHALPFFGRAWVGYAADETIIGLSKLTRLVRLFARRFTLQERMGAEIADTLHRLMIPHGVAVHIEGIHLCTRMRGVADEESVTHTSHWRGGYAKEPALRDEFQRIIGRRA